MQVVPNAQIRSFASCNPGELIRLDWHGECCFALVAAKGKQRYLISLSGDPDSGPWYTPVNEHQFSTVVSYGRDYTVEVDHGGPMGISGSELWGKNGTISLTGSSWLLQVHPFRNNAPLTRIFCDLASGAVEDSPSSGAVFAKWKIYLPQPQVAIQRLPALFAYSAI